MARPSNTDARRAQIADALIAVMARRGYDGASIAEIARRARVAPGLVHYHFEDKLEILLEAVRAIGARHARALDAALAASPDPAAQLVAFIQVHLGLGAHQSPDALACWVIAAGEALRERKVRAPVAQILTDLTARLADILRRGHAAHHFTCPDPEAAAAALVATIQGYFTVAATARAVIPPGSAARSTLRMAEGLVRPRRPLTTPLKSSCQ